MQTTQHLRYATQKIPQYKEHMSDLKYRNTYTTNMSSNNITYPYLSIPANIHVKFYRKIQQDPEMPSQERTSLTPYILL